MSDGHISFREMNWNTKSVLEDDKTAIKYMRLTDKELDTFIDMRINQLREEGGKREYRFKTSDVQMEESDCCQACLPVLITDEWELQKSCFTGLSREQESMAAGQYRLPLLIWVLNFIRHMGLFTTEALCNTSYKINWRLTEKLI